MGCGFRKIRTETNPPSRSIGYARVSAYGQTLNAQLGQQA